MGTRRREGLSKGGGKQQKKRKKRGEGQRWRELEKGRKSNEGRRV